MASKIYEWLNAREAAHALGVTDARVRQLLLTGELSGRKATRSVWIVHRDEVERLRKRRERN